MTQFIEQIGGWTQELIATIGYPGIVLMMALENIFPPVPSEIVLPFAGALSAKGDMNFWGAVAAGTSGSLIGAVVLYAVGYVAREAGVRRLVAACGKYVFISERDLDRGAAWFERYEEAVILFGRLIPIIRSIISFPPGYTRMRIPRFLFYTALGATAWNLVLTYVGRVLGENWEDIIDFLEPYQAATLAVLVLAVLGFLGWRVLHRRWQPPAS